MSDEYDAVIIILGEKIAMLYAELRQACSELPVAPINLPAPPKGGTLDVSSELVISAVRRVIDIAEELPVSDDVIRGVFSACVYWTAAMDLLALQVAEPDIKRGAPITACIFNCEQSLVLLRDTLSEGR